MVDQSSSGGNPPTLGQVQDGSRGLRSPNLSLAQKLPSMGEFLASQSKSMSSIAQTMEARTEEKGALLVVKIDIQVEKQKAAQIANLERAKDLGAIIEDKFKAQVRALLGLGGEGATSKVKSALHRFDNPTVKLFPAYDDAVLCMVICTSPNFQ